MNELRETSVKMSVTENNKLICISQTKLYLKEDDKTRTTSKANFAHQTIQQSDKMTALIVHLKTENELRMKQNMLSKEYEDDVTRLDELRRLLETRAGEKESTISYLKEDITKIDTSKEDSNKQLQEQRDKTSELSVKLSIAIGSRTQTKRWSNENQA